LARVVTLQGVVAGVEKDGAVVVKLDGEAERSLTVNRSSAATAVKPGDRAEISIRPEHIEILPDQAADGAPNVINGEIEDILFVGDRFETRVGIGGASIIIDLPSEGAWRDGQKLYIRFDRDVTSLWPLNETSPGDAV
jgi:ABC-type Fe3+/spermidine/putrescine transport system ATPase subunit